MNEYAYDHDTASTEQKPWIDPVLEEFEVEKITEGSAIAGPDFASLS